MGLLGWLKLKVKRCSRAAPNPTPRRKLSLFLFSLLFLFLFLFLFPFLSIPFPSFPSFRPSSFLFLFSPWGWVRRCLAASLSLLSLLSVSCFRLLCFQLPLSLLLAFAFFLAFVFCFSLRFLYILSSFHPFLHILCPRLGAYIGSHGI